MRSKRYVSGILVLILVFLSGCGLRTRTGIPPQNGEGSPNGTESALLEGDSSDDGSAETRSTDAGGEKIGEPDPNAETRPDRTAERREFDENASAELSADAQKSVIEPGDGDELPDKPRENDGKLTAAGEKDGAELTVTETLTMDGAEVKGVSQEADEADSLLKYYQTLISSVVQPIFECHRLNVYWETETDGQTVYKSSAEHGVITQAGGYDVAVKRLEDGLIVDDGWIERKNPGCIVKTVNEDVLGRGVMGRSAAEAVRESLMQRDGLKTTDAVKKGCVVLISESLLKSPAGQTAAALYVACAMYPDLFEGVDPASAAKALLSESAGEDMDGLYAIY